MTNVINGRWEDVVDAHAMGTNNSPLMQGM
jgi:hypothetical protein